MECPKCGAFVTDEDRFCGECGQPLSGPTSPAKPLTPMEAKDLPTLDLAAAAKPSRPTVVSARQKKILPWLLVFGGLTLLAMCLFGAAILYLFEPKPSPSTPRVQPTPPIVGYQDDFGDPNSGWDVYDEDDARAEYSDGGYRVGVYRTDYVAWGNPAADRQFDDITVEVDARQVEGPVGSNFGLLIRYQPDDENFYWFEISSDGYYSVDLMRAGQWVTLVDWNTSDAIEQGIGATNHLKVECIGNRFLFYVNGLLLTEVTDSAFRSGNIGLAAGTFDEPGTVVYFDNVVVYSYP
ncbi:MAG: zinc ribbon domain-containing protein [Anaerolineae bacterium]